MYSTFTQLSPRFKSHSQHRSLSKNSLTQSSLLRTNHSTSRLNSAQIMGRTKANSLITMSGKEQYDNTSQIMYNKKYAPIKHKGVYQTKRFNQNLFLLQNRKLKIVNDEQKKNKNSQISKLEGLSFIKAFYQIQSELDAGSQLWDYSNALIESKAIKLKLEKTLNQFIVCKQAHKLIDNNQKEKQTNIKEQIQKKLQAQFQTKLKKITEEHQKQRLKLINQLQKRENKEKEIKINNQVGNKQIKKLIKKQKIQQQISTLTPHLQLNKKQQENLLQISFKKQEKTFLQQPQKSSLNKQIHTTPNKIIKKTKQPKPEVTPKIDQTSQFQVIKLQKSPQVTNNKSTSYQEVSQKPNKIQKQQKPIQQKQTIKPPKPQQMQKTKKQEPVKNQKQNSQSSSKISQQKMKQVRNGCNLIFLVGQVAGVCMQRLKKTKAQWRIACLLFYRYCYDSLIEYQASYQAAYRQQIINKQQFQTQASQNKIIKEQLSKFYKAVDKKSKLTEEYSLAVLSESNTKQTILPWIIKQTREYLIKIKQNGEDQLIDVKICALHMINCVFIIQKMLGKNVQVIEDIDQISEDDAKKNYSQFNKRFFTLYK